MSGSTAVDNTSVGVTATGITAMGFSVAAASVTGYTSLAAANVAAALAATLTVPTSAQIVSGATTFYIGGVLTIPGYMHAGFYGGYTTITASTVTVNDGI